MSIHIEWQNKNFGELWDNLIKLGITSFHKYIDRLVNKMQSAVKIRQKKKEKRGAKKHVSCDKRNKAYYRVNFTSKQIK